MTNPKLNTDEIIIIARSKAGFICRCEKVYQSANTLQRHATHCGKRRHREEKAQLSESKTKAVRVADVVGPFDTEPGLMDLEEDLDLIKINVEYKTLVCVVCRICVSSEKLLNLCARA